jgi:hypothetical protein
MVILLILMKKNLFFFHLGVVPCFYHCIFSASKAESNNTVQFGKAKIRLPYVCKNR